MMPHRSLSSNVSRRLYHRRAATSLTSLSSTTHLQTRQLSSNTPKQQQSPTLWKTLKAPTLFGAGLYLGLVAFGEHQETKEESAYLAGLRSKFWGGSDGGDVSNGGSASGVVGKNGDDTKR